MRNTSRIVSVVTISRDAESYGEARRDRRLPDAWRAAEYEQERPTLPAQAAPGLVARGEVSTRPRFDRTRRERRQLASIDIWTGAAGQLALDLGSNRVRLVGLGAGGEDTGRHQALGERQAEARRIADDHNATVGRQVARHLSSPHESDRTPLRSHARHRMRWPQ
ncbi:MAG: hypothetical protein H0T89_32910 [Deltaproteobacteria bacterium]|nr:hypothetical protein [Deltaproteobacteria bacterium]MDQ3295618.1 hypothetical protein [Myxococcota bacterium]